MAMPDESDLRWDQDVQGVLEAHVSDTNRAFRTVTAEIHKLQLRVPTKIWMDGRDLPPAAAWRGILRSGAREDLNLRILFNNRTVFRQRRNYMTALVLLAWLNSSDRTEHANGIFRTRISSPEALAWIDEFLGEKNAMGTRRTTQPHVNQILNEAANEICESGGLAVVDKARETAERFKHWFRDALAFQQHASSQEGPVSHFTMWLREPPGFLPVFRRKSSN
jgi:hypothetical protein